MKGVKIEGELKKNPGRQTKYQLIYIFYVLKLEAFLYSVSVSAAKSIVLIVNVDIRSVLN